MMSANENDKPQTLSTSAANDLQSATKTAQGPSDKHKESEISQELVAEVEDAAVEAAPRLKQEKTKASKPEVKKKVKKSVANKVKKVAAKPKQSVQKVAAEKVSAAPTTKPFERAISISYIHPTTPKEMEKLMTKNKAQFERFTHDASEFGKENMEAFVKCGTLFAKGFEELMRTSVALAQDTAEKQAQFVKEAMSSKSLNEFTEVNNKIAQTSFDDFMASATKISELGVKVLTESTKPLNDQVNKTIQKATESMAA